MNGSVPGTGRWWEIEALVLFGISVHVLPTALSLLALWVGREIARDPKRKMTRRQNVFLNLGLVLITFLIVSGKLFVSAPLQVGWATFAGFGIGLNGIVLFELMEGAFYTIASNALNTIKGGPPRDGANGSEGV